MCLCVGVVVGGGGCICVCVCVCVCMCVCCLSLSEMFLCCLLSVSLCSFCVSVIRNVLYTLCVPVLSDNKPQELMYTGGFVTKGCLWWGFTVKQGANHYLSRMFDDTATSCPCICFFNMGSIEGANSLQVCV